MTERDLPRDHLIWDEQGQPYSAHFGDVYFSKLSGIDESRYVFIDHNRLPQRFQALSADAQFVVGETGFGTGLNFLTCWQSWREHAPVHACLHFVSVEKYPLNREQLRQAHALWPELAELAAQLVDAYPPMPVRGFQRLVFDQGKVQLTLIPEDAAQGLQQLLPLAAPEHLPNAAASQPTWGGARGLYVDAWFLDGFAPAKNPDMWTPALFQALARLSSVGTSFATFTAARVVKQGLHQAGFHIEKTRGFGRKRHMLCGTYQSQRSENLPGRTGTSSRRGLVSWHLVAKPVAPKPDTASASSNRHALVVGAGLAGCHTARALAERGYQITIIDSGSIAAGASGNPQGVVYAKASSQDQPLTNFNLTALQFACHYYRNRIGFDICGHASGVFHLAQDVRQATEYQSLAQRYAMEPQFVQWLDRQNASEACGVPLSNGGLLFGQAGWLQPPQLCRALLDHPGIRLIEYAPVSELLHDQGQWQAIGTDEAPLARAPIAILANASHALEQAQTAHFPLKAIRGQISQVPVAPASQNLRRVLCGKGYIAPALTLGDTATHCLGATFNLGSTEPSPDPADDLENLSQVAKLSPELANLTKGPWQEACDNRVAFRCTTPDYLPIVGPAPIAAEMQNRFASLRDNALRTVDFPGSYYPGLFVNLGHGSRGLAYTPLCGELLASMISGSPLPLSHNMVLRLHPGRFIIRDITRSRR